MNAILKSKRYVRERWFDIFLRLFLVWLVSAILGIVPLIGPILSLHFFPFTMIFICLIYQDLKAIKGEGFIYQHSSGEKFKWIGIGALAYIVLPLLIIGILGASLTIPLLVLKGMLNSQGQETVIVPPMGGSPFSHEPGSETGQSAPVLPDSMRPETEIGHSGCLPGSVANQCVATIPLLR